MDYTLPLPTKTTEKTVPTTKTTKKEEKKSVYFYFVDISGLNINFGEKKQQQKL
jgi:hypothetical protein